MNKQARQEDFRFCVILFYVSVPISKKAFMPRKCKIVLEQFLRLVLEKYQRGN